MLAEGALFHLSESSPRQSVIGPWPLVTSLDTRRLYTLGGCHLLTMSQKAGSHPSHPGASPFRFLSSGECWINEECALTRTSLVFVLTVYIQRIIFLIMTVGAESYCPLFLKKNAEWLGGFPKPPLPAHHWDVELELISDSSTLMSLYRHALPLMTLRLNQSRNLLAFQCLRVETMTVVF